MHSVISIIDVYSPADVARKMECTENSNSIFFVLIKYYNWVICFELLLSLFLKVYVLNHMFLMLSYFNVIIMFL